MYVSAQLSDTMSATKTRSRLFGVLTDIIQFGSAFARLKRCLYGCYHAQNNDVAHESKNSQGAPRDVGDYELPEPTPASAVNARAMAFRTHDTTQKITAAA